MKKINLYLKLGKISNENGQFEKAITSYEDALLLDPGNEVAADSLVEILVSRKSIQEAIDVTLAVISNVRSSASEKRFHRVLGDLYLKLGNHRKAIETFEILNRLGPDAPTISTSRKPTRLSEDSEDTPNVWNEFGLVMNKVGSYDDAVEAFEKGIALDPSLPYLHLNLGQVYLLQGKLTEALEEFEEAYENTTDTEGRVAIINRMIAVFKLENRADMIDLGNQIVTALSVSISKHNGGYMLLPISSIIKPEMDIEEDKLRDMIESLRGHGIIQPLVISPADGSQKFNIVAGRKRFFAAQIVGLESIPVIVREVSEMESIEISYHENLHNTSSDPEMDEERYHKLSSNYDLSIEGIAKTTGMSSFSVANRMKAVGGRTVMETRQSARGEKALIEKMIGSLKTDEVESVVPTAANFDHQGFEVNEEIFEDSKVAGGALWYMDETPANVVTGPTKVNFSKLFSRASGIIKANPHHQNVSA